MAEQRRNRVYDFDFPSLVLNVWITLHQAQYAADRVVDRELGEVGLSSAELWTLFVLEHHHGPPTPAEIARWIFRESHSVAGLLGRMEKQGLIKRGKDNSNRRLTRVFITAKGRQLYERANETRIVARLMSDFSRSDLEKFREKLRLLRDAALGHLGLKTRVLKFKGRSSKV